MVNISTILKSVLNIEKVMDITKLPSQGLFYKDDFKLKLKKASIDDIIEYEKDFIKDDLGVIIEKVKTVVRKNTILENGYTFYDIKSIDVVFLFLEIVKLTKRKPLLFLYVTDDFQKIEVEFSEKNFNYFFIKESLMSKYNSHEKCFEIDGYKYSLPSIGVENSLTNFLVSKSHQEDVDKYNYYFYDFTYFLGDKTELSFQEVENLIEIFNGDVSEKEMLKINKILKTFEPIQKYSLIKNGYVIDTNSKIDLEKIWI